MKTINEKVYLGDGVYARLDEYGSVVLTTENGYRASNIIVLEREVTVALVAYLKRLAAFGAAALAGEGT